MTAVQLQPERVEPSSPARAGFRGDIEGLRAVAVLLVVAFHAGVPFISGGFVGVDVFFVISGFLITGLLISEVQRTGRVSIARFYARRIRRLLPLSTVVVVATAVAAVFIIPAIDRPALLGDLRASALWYANWHFAAGATQYMADVNKSAALHYWSLSVEEQFYVVWPLLIVLVVGARKVAKHAGRSWRPDRNRLLLVLATIAVVSYLLSGLTTLSNGPWAYFGLQTRAWELAAGGCLALIAPSLRRLTRGAAIGAGATGLGAIVASAVLFGRTTTFPGWLAAVPVLGSVLVLAAGERTQEGTARLLRVPALTYVGRISYGWYLWHWPCLILAGAIWAQPNLDPDLNAGGSTGPGLLPTIGAVALSFGLASLTFRIVEEPFRRSATLIASTPKTLALGVVLLVVAVGVPAQLLSNDGSAAARSAESGAGASVPGSGKPVALTMTPAQARTDTGENLPRCFVDFPDTKVDPSCRFGDPAGQQVVVLIGDSHAAHWFPAMDAIAKRNHWQLMYWAKPACSFANVHLWTTAFNREYTECATWRANVYKEIAALPRVDAVVVGRSFSYLSAVMNASGSISKRDEGAALWRTGAQSAFATLAKSTPSIVMIREIPRPGQDVPACLSEHEGHPDACSYSRLGHTDLDKTLFAEEESVLPAGHSVHYVDLGAAVCPTDPCSVISPKGAIIFRDLHHLTATFALEISPQLEAAIKPYVGG